MDSEDEREEEFISWRGIPGTIILINMFDPVSSETWKVAHAATCRMVRHHLRLSDSHLVGVCLYGTEESCSSTFGTKNLIDVIPLSAPSLEDFKKLRSIGECGYKQAKELQLSDVLWHCSKMFANCKKQLSSRTVILLTRLDVPPITTDQKPALKRVGDLAESNIDLKLINVAPEEYAIDIFYENFLTDANKDGDYIIPKPIWDLKEIAQIMSQELHRHLAVARLGFQIGENMSIGVGVYNLLIKPGTYHLKKVNLDRETNALVTSSTKMMKVVTNTPNSHLDTLMDIEESEPKQVPILKSEILHYLEYGGERIEFTDAEKKNIQNPFGPPMMKLLGFKPARIMCKEKWFLKTGYFLFPSENKIKGSTVAFKAMHQACVETGTVALCVLCTRVNSKPKIVALEPCTHPLGLDVDIGFNVIHIPFIENLRDIPPVENDEDSGDTSDEQKTLMTKILKSIVFDFKADMFENPKLQSEYQAIEAIALEEDFDAFTDTTKPKSDQFQNIPEDEFEELFGPFGSVPAKRNAAASTEGGTKTKRGKAGEDIDVSLIDDRYQCQTVHKFKTTELKIILKRLNNSNIPSLTNLKKPELVDLVYKYYNS